MLPEKWVVLLQSSRDLCERKRARSGIVQCFITPDIKLLLEHLTLVWQVPELCWAARTWLHVVCGLEARIWGDIAPGHIPCCQPEVRHTWSSHVQPLPKSAAIDAGQRCPRRKELVSSTGDCTVQQVDSWNCREMRTGEEHEHCWNLSPLKS